VRLSCRVLPGLEFLAAEEVRELTGRATSTVRGRVYLEGDPRDVYRLNLAGGCLLRVLVERLRTQVGDLSEVYEAVRAVPHEEDLPRGRSFAVRAKRYGEHPFTSMDVADRVGQAVIDRVRDRRGDRPPVDLDEPEVILRVLLRDDRLTLGLDTTGDSLHRRGYRRNRHAAPLNPTVARAMLRAAGWSGEALLDPMCGSGTIPIEAAARARGLPAGRLRGRFLFQHLSFFEASAWERVERSYSSSGEGEADARVRLGTDRSSRAIEFARENARRANVGDDVTFRVDQLEALDIPGDVSTVVTNPPFGQRSGRPYRMQTLYRRFWDRMHEAGVGTVAAVSGNPRFDRAAPDGLEVHPFLLGDRHCRLVVHRASDPRGETGA